MHLIQDQVLKSQDYTTTPLPMGEYENCSFENCNFSASKLSGVIFSECEFINCDLTTAEVRNTGFKEVHFDNCKLLGINFGTCSKFLLSFRFQDCLLNFSSFYGLKVPNTHFLNCKLREVDFSESILSKSVFSNCDLHAAIFQNSNLQTCDFRTSFHYSIDPENNRVAKATFSLPEVLGLLEKYKIKVS